MIDASSDYAAAKSNECRVREKSMAELGVVSLHNDGEVLNSQRKKKKHIQTRKNQKINSYLLNYFQAGQIATKQKSNPPQMQRT